MTEYRDEVIQVKLTKREKSMFFRVASRLTIKRGKRVSVGAMLRELVQEEDAEGEPVITQELTGRITQ